MPRGGWMTVHASDGSLSARKCSLSPVTMSTLSPPQSECLRLIVFISTIRSEITPNMRYHLRISHKHLDNDEGIRSGPPAVVHDPKAFDIGI